MENEKKVRNISIEEFTFEDQPENNHYTVKWENVVNTQEGDNYTTEDKKDFATKEEAEAYVEELKANEEKENV